MSIITRHLVCLVQGKKLETMLSDFKFSLLENGITPIDLYHNGINCFTVIYKHGIGSNYNAAVRMFESIDTSYGEFNKHKVFEVTNDTKGFETTVTRDNERPVCCLYLDGREVLKSTDLDFMCAISYACQRMCAISDSLDAIADVHIEEEVFDSESMLSAVYELMCGIFEKEKDKLTRCEKVLYLAALSALVLNPALREVISKEAVDIHKE